MKPSVLVAMSGGVDSSVVALLLHQHGHPITGVTLKLYENEDVGESVYKPCCSIEDAADARLVCERFGESHFIYNQTPRFRETVMQQFADAYLQGLTPNPCLECNRFMKFSTVLDKADELGIDKIATGHYAIVEFDEGRNRWVLKKAVDDTKDQSYVLYMLDQRELSRTLFPLGSLRKTEVRKIAEENDLINAKKPDSQDICFVRDGDYAAFIEEWTGEETEPGDFLNTKGEVIGKHKGVIHYTIGQRRGLGIAAEKPLYVIAKSAKDNTVTLGFAEDLGVMEIDVAGLNWIAVERLTAPTRAKVKVRYHQQEQPATLTPILAEDPKDDHLHIAFDEPQRGVAPGQAAVFYEEDVVLGGGTIQL